MMIGLTAVHLARAGCKMKKSQELLPERFLIWAIVGTSFFAYCIMSNHVHLLIEHQRVKQAEHGGKSANYPVTEALRLLKGSTARLCNIQLNRTGSFWQHESYDHFVRTEGELEWTIRYILQNPVKAGLVNEWKSWKFTYVNPVLGEW